MGSTSNVPPHRHGEISDAKQTQNDSDSEGSLHPSREELQNQAIADRASKEDRSNSRFGVGESPANVESAGHAATSSNARVNHTQDPAKKSQHD